MDLSEKLRPLISSLREFAVYSASASVRKNWLPAAALVILGGIFLVWHLSLRELRTVDGIRWTLSAMVQAIAAVAGLLLVGLTLLWTQASNARSHLRSVRRRYFNLLRGPLAGDTLIEQVRREYMQGLKRHRKDLRDDPYPWKHEKYPTHKKVGRGLALLSMFISEIYDVRPKSLGEGSLSKDLVWLGFDEDEVYSVYADVYRVRTNEAEAMEMVTDLVNVGSNFMNVLPTPADAHMSPSDLAGKVWDWSQDDDVEGSLERVHTLERMSGVQMKVALLLFVTTIAVGLFVLLSSRENAALWPTSLSLALALASLEAIVILLNDMLQPR